MTTIFINIFDTANPERKAELDFCILENMGKGNHFYGYDERLTFNQLFANFGEGLNIIANSDIIIPHETIALANEHLKPMECFALSRWDVKSKENYQATAQPFHFPDTQDSWFFMGKVPQIEGADFTLGVPGCDNKIAHLLRKAGFKVTNPCKSLKTYHFHLSNIRTYTDSDSLKEPFEYVEPCSL